MSRNRDDGHLKTMVVGNSMSAGEPCGELVDGGSMMLLLYPRFIISTLRLSQPKARSGHSQASTSRGRQGLQVHDTGY